MDINNLQGPATYSRSLEKTSQVDNEQIREQNLEASRTELNSENSNTAKKAFEVTITQEAQEAQEAQDKPAVQNAEKTPPETQTTTSDDHAAQNPEAAHRQNQLVNIVA